MRITAMICAALAAASCAVEGGKGTAMSVFAPAAAVSAIISPQFVVVTPVAGSACAIVPAFDTDFSLLVTTGSQVAVDSVTISLGDGSNVGGPTVTIPSSGLEQMFGSLVVVDSRSFAFHHRFGCGTFRPSTLFVEMMVRERSGATRRLTTSARVR